MKVLIVYSGNPQKGVAPFVLEQANSLKDAGVEVGLFPIKKGGIRGYIAHVIELNKLVRESNYDIIHGHYLWSVIVCLFQYRVPVVGTLHGTDMNKWFMKLLAKYFALLLSKRIIVVNNDMAGYLRNVRVRVIPCGVDISIFKPLSGSDLKKHPVIDENKSNILFCSRFDRYEKNYPLAKEATELVNKSVPVNLIELVGLNRQEVSSLLNQVDILLMTSLWEGSPQVVKEAMACNCPVVTTNVGDVQWLLLGVSNCRISKDEPGDIAKDIVGLLGSKYRSNGRNRIIELELDNETIAKKVMQVYQEIVRK